MKSKSEKRRENCELHGQGEIISVNAALTSARAHKRCIFCGELLPLGPAKEDGPQETNVILEMIAAQMACGDLKMTRLHRRGYLARASGKEPQIWEPTLTWQVGWLVHAIRNHTKEQRCA